MTARGWSVQRVHDDEVVVKKGSLKLYGLTEIAEALDLQPGLVTVWHHRGRLPEPTARLAMGPVWEEADIGPWLAHVRRTSLPRPRTPAQS